MTSDPNAEIRAELRRMHEEATPRRWIATDSNGVVQIRSPHGLIAKLPARYGDAADASLIVATRNALPALLDKLDAAHAEIESLARRVGSIPYRGYCIEHDPKPIPRSMGCDWSWWHADYDGAPHESGGPPADHRCGTAGSFEEAKREIDEQIAEEQAP